MTYKGLLLDIDNTLYDYQPVHELSLQKVFDYGVEALQMSENQLREAFRLGRADTHLQLAETAASHNRLLYFQAMLERLNVNALKHAQAMYDAYWDTFLDNLSLRPDAQQFLQQLRSKGIEKVCLLTDLTAHIQYRKVAVLGLGDYVDFIVTSEEAGREKPHSSMFWLGMNKLRCSEAETIMVGDSLKKDIQGAARLDIRSFWLAQGEEVTLMPSTSTRVETLTEILDLL